MATKISTSKGEYVLEDFLSRTRTIITIGRQTDEAYNVIALDEDVDIFLCQLTHNEDGWTLKSGQWRTECPKGIRSDLQHACSMCRGCCVNVRTANPKYSWRMPTVPATINGKTIPEEGVIVKEGDWIECGGRRIVCF